MNLLKAATCAASVLVLSGCANVDKVLFVTDTSFGINIDTKPATASIGYDRNEGYFGPRYQNGAAPPVLASLETGGNVFNPEIRQLYATGQAAAKAVNSEAVSGPTSLSPDTGRKLMVFGTSTNFGVKVGFGTAAYPDSFSFGYKRKEMSWIPLGVGQAIVKGKDRNGADTEIVVPVHVYPSVLGTIDTTIATTGTVDGTGLTSRQFFATGEAAEALAVTEGQALRDVASQAVGEITAGGRAARKTADEGLAEIRAFLTPGGGFSTARRDCLVDAANAKKANSVSAKVKTMTDADGVLGRLTAPRSIAAVREQIPTCQNS